MTSINAKAPLWASQTLEPIFHNFPHEHVIIHSIHSIQHLGVEPKIGVFPQKWMVYNEKPIKKDDLEVPLFLETSNLAW